MEEGKKRTIQQNKALHKYFDNLAKSLNSAGLDMKTVLKPGVDIPWSKESVKEFIWKPIQRAYKIKDSTTALETKDINIIYETITRHLGEKFGITEPFPSIEEVMFEESKLGRPLIAVKRAEIISNPIK
jgi:stalled ribosome rescue protein Dom34